MAQNKKKKKIISEETAPDGRADKMFVLLLAIALGLFLLAVAVIFLITVVNQEDEPPADGGSTTAASSDEDWYDDEDALFWYRYENDLTVAIAGYKYQGNSLDIRVPSVFDGRTVTRLDDYAFIGQETPTSVYIPKSVTSIGAAIFGNATGFTVHFEGSEEEWLLIAKDEDNLWLTECQIVFENK